MPDVLYVILPIAGVIVGWFGSEYRHRRTRQGLEQSFHHGVEQIQDVIRSTAQQPALAEPSPSMGDRVKVLRGVCSVLFDGLTTDGRDSTLNALTHMGMDMGASLSGMGNEPADEQDRQNKLAMLWAAKNSSSRFYRSVSAFEGGGGGREGDCRKSMIDKSLTGFAATSHIVFSCAPSRESLRSRQPTRDAVLVS